MSPSGSQSDIASQATSSQATSSRANSLSDYRLLALVGQGQFAQVYSAVHRRSGRLVAIKQTRHARETESHEPLVMCKLNHPNVVRCHEIITGATGYQLVLDYCEGGTLRSHLNSTQNIAAPLPITEIKTLISDILKGLSHIHRNHIVHGDLKPENIFLTYPSEPRKHRYPLAKIGDFGSARPLRDPSHSHKEIGSPTYAAPERFEGQSSPASDLYAIGVMLYELLVGDRPFSGTPEALKKAHQTQSVFFPATLSSSAQSLLTTALHKNPRKRFRTAAAMLSTLQQLSEDTENLPPPALPKGLSQSSLSQATIAIPSHGISAPIASLTTIPQGCCIATDRSLHLLTRRKELLSIARFRQPCWITVSPNGKWFVAISKQPTTNKITTEVPSTNKAISQHTVSQYRKSKGMLGSFSARSGHQRRRFLTLTGPLLTALRSHTLQLIGLDARHFARISTNSTKTYIECFTRRGQFVGQMSLNLPLSQVIPTATPYQFIGLSTATARAPATVVIVTLKPFHVQPIRLPIEPQKVSALPWGYLVSYQRNALLLDRSAQVLNRLSEVPTGSAIAAINAHNLLIASTKTAAKNDLSLLVANVKSLNLDIIF